MVTSPFKQINQQDYLFKGDNDLASSLSFPVSVAGVEPTVGNLSAAAALEARNLSNSSTR